MMSPKNVSPIVIILLLLFCVRSFAGCFESERLALLKFKQSLFGDDTGLLSSWNETEDCCKWRGIACDNSTRHVVHLNLSGYDEYFDLKGNTMSPSLLELPHLNYLDLTYIDFGRARLPEFIGSLDKLTTLRLYSCNLSGGIPFQLGNLSRLETLNLGHNHFYGVESLEWISHLSSLTYLDLSHTNLSKANWLNVVAKLPRLEVLFLSQCSLEVPKWASSFHFNSSTSLGQLDLSYNSLTSSIYPWLLNSSSNLEYLYLRNNRLEDGITEEHVSSLVLSDNSFTGSMSVLCAITGGKLTFLDLSNNVLSGKLPDCWKQFPELVMLNVANNNLFGNIPKTIGSLHKMEVLDFYNNNFSGVLPINLKNCVALKHMNLGNNRITGEIPIWMGENLLQLILLSLRSNSFYGSIPSQLCHLQWLQVLDLSLNNISGTIPKCVNALQYSENPGLCGLPLDECNSLTEDDGNTQVPKIGDAFFTIWFYVPMELGYIIGLLGFFITLYFNDSWRYSYCQFLNVLVKKVYG